MALKFNTKHFIGYGLSTIMLGLTVVAFASVWDKWPTFDQWFAIFDRKHLIAVLMFFATMGLATFLRGLRWQRLMTPFHILTFREAVSIYGWSFFLVVFLPYRLGETVRPLWIKRLGATGFGALGAQVLERINDLVAMLLTAAFVIMLLPQLEGWMQTTGAAFFFLGMGGYVFFLLLIAPIQRWLTQLHQRNHSKMVKRLSLLSEGLAAITDRREFIMQILLTVLIWSVLACGYYVFLSSFFPELPWIVGPAMLVMIALSSILPITPGNIGLYEAAAVFLLVQLGHNNEEALVAAITLHTSELTMTLFIGLAARLALYLAGRIKVPGIR